jgi:predicted RNA binding protein YcfA (HicA-like mRNA interferase family)
MPRLIPLPAKSVLKLLLKNGFTILRITGSHHFLINKASNKTTTIPIHGNEELGQGLLRKILRDSDISVEEFETLRTK